MATAVQAEITYDNMCDRLVDAVPGLAPAYQTELDWWKGETPGPYNIFPHIVRPYIVEMNRERNDGELRRVFDFLEILLANDDPEVGYVVHDLMESLASWSPFDMPRLRPLMGVQLGKIADGYGPYDKETVRMKMRRLLDLNPDKRAFLWDLQRDAHLRDPLFLREFGDDPEKWLDG